MSRLSHRKIALGKSDAPWRLAAVCPGWGTPGGHPERPRRGAETPPHRTPGDPRTSRKVVPQGGGRGARGSPRWYPDFGEDWPNGVDFPMSLTQGLQHLPHVVQPSVQSRAIVAMSGHLKIAHHIGQCPGHLGSHGQTNTLNQCPGHVQSFLKMPPVGMMCSQAHYKVIAPCPARCQSLRLFFQKKQPQIADAPGNLAMSSHHNPHTSACPGRHHPWLPHDPGPVCGWGTHSATLGVCN